MFGESLDLTLSGPASATVTTTPWPEMINGPFKAGVISRRGSWRSLEGVEYATLGWVDWFNNCLLLEPIRNIPSAEAEADFYEALEADDMAS